MQHERTVPAPQRGQAPDPLKVKAIADVLDVDRATVYREIKSGRLTAYRVGSGRGTLRVNPTVFEQYLADRGIPAMTP
jgi:excisionase family DNA binding protein